MERYLLQTLLLFLVFVAALRSGGKAERYVASVYVAMHSLLSVYIFSLDRDLAGYTGIHFFRLFLDVVALLIVVRIAVIYDRWWTLWVGSAQFIAVMAHLLRMLGMPIPPLAYAVMERWPVWIAIALTGLGTWLYSRRCAGTVSDT
ncbi:MAG: hypothetical protein WBA51_19500 [Erythrobacter sp.]